MTAENKGFIQFNRGADEFWELIRRRPSAFVLLAVIAQRARRSDKSSFNDLEIGEALIGDYETYGVTEKIYRNDKNLLEKHKFAAFRGASKGTTAKLLDTSIFDINTFDRADGRANKGRTRGGRGATNNNGKNEKNVKEIYTAYKGKINENSRLTDAARKKISNRLNTFSSEDLLRAIENFSIDLWWMEHNAHRGVAWFFNSDDRIDGFLTMEPKRDLYRSPDNKVFESKDEWQKYMESIWNLKDGG